MKFCLTRKHTALSPAWLVMSILLFSPVSAQMNQEVMMKWMDVTIVHYAVSGDYEGEVIVVNNGTNGLATVKDHVQFDFDFDISKGSLVGAPTFTDAASEMGAIRNGADGCRPPALSGKYEHSTIESLKEGYGGQLVMMVRTDYPAAQMTVACTGGNEAVAAHSVTEPQEFVVPGIMLLAMGDAMTGDDLKLSADGNSFIVKKNGWTYLITPSKVK